MASSYEFFRYTDAAGEWRWRFKAPNGVNGQWDLPSGGQQNCP